LAGAFTNIDERALLLQVAVGDENAFAALFSQYGPQLHSYLSGMTRSMAAAEELVQNTFIRVWISRDQLPAIEFPKAWIYKIASNEALNFLKRRALEVKIINHLQAHEHAPQTDTDDVLYNEMKAAIRDAVASLSDRRQQVYHMSREQGMKQQDIADALGISLVTVKNTLGAALEGIRAHLRERGLLMLAVLFTLH